MIKLINITKKFKDTTILNNFCLSANIGESIAISGPSGSGKTTLLQIAGLIDMNYSGEIYINDILIKNEAQMHAIRKEKFGFVFQFHNLLPEFTVLENIMMPQRIVQKYDREYIMQMIARVGLLNKIHKMPQELSGGECQRVAILRALANKPKIILADEPTGNLDPELGLEVFEMLKNFAIINNSILIMVTHNITLANKLGRIIHFE